MLCFSSFPKREFLLIPIGSQYSHSADVCQDLCWTFDNGCTGERVCILVGVHLNGCTAEHMQPSWCAALPRKDSSVPQWRNWSSCIGQDKRWEQTRSRCFVSPTISYLLLQSKAVITDHPSLCLLLPNSVQCNLAENVMHIRDWYRDFPLRPACCRNPLVSRSRHTHTHTHTHTYHVCPRGWG
jgi:hypothetical protein